MPNPLYPALQKTGYHGFTFRISHDCARGKSRTESLSVADGYALLLSTGVKMYAETTSHALFGEWRFPKRLFTFSADAMAGKLGHGVRNILIRIMSLRHLGKSPNRTFRSTPRLFADSGDSCTRHFLSLIKSCFFIRHYISFLNFL